MKMSIFVKLVDLKLKHNIITFSHKDTVALFAKLSVLTVKFANFAKKKPNAKTKWDNILKVLSVMPHTYLTNCML